MAEAGHLVSGSRGIKSIPSSYPPKLLSHTCKTVSVSRGKHFTQRNRKSSRGPSRGLITISTGDGRWQGKWTSEYLLSLQDLHLEDLIEDEQKDAEVSINLCVQKHASFGFSVDGRIITSFTRKCCNCSSPYYREVIYVKPGKEAGLDSLIQDTIRLTTSAKDTCSESCEKSETTFQYIGGQNAASIDKRWFKLLELKKATL